MDHELKTDFRGFADFESVITSNDLLMKNILSHMAFEDLLTCSLINQRWRHYCRKELRRGKCLASVNSGTKAPCLMLQELNKVLETMPAESIPFSGLRIDYSKSSEKCPVIINGHYGPDLAYYPNGKTMLFCSTDWLVSGMLAKCPVQYLRVSLGNWRCSSQQFLKLLFKTRGREIEHLTISHNNEYDLPGLANSLGVAEASNWLPNLTTLEMESKLTEEVLILIVNGAPNLREIRGYVGILHTRFLVEAKKVHLVTEFRLKSRSPVDEETLDASLEFARRKPRLKSLYVDSAMHNDPWESQQWLEILALLMEGSAATLKKLDIAHIDLLLLSSLEIPPMLKLKELTQSYFSKLDGHLEFINSQQWIDYPSLFPVLHSVHFYECYAYGSHRFKTVPENLQRLLSKLSSRAVRSSSMCYPDFVDITVFNRFIW